MGYLLLTNGTLCSRCYVQPRTTWIPKIHIKYVDTKNQLADILTKGSFSRNEWNHLLCLFNTMCFSTFFGSHLKSSFSQTRERLVIGAMSKGGQDTTSSHGSPMTKARPTNLVLQGHPGNEYNRKRVSLATANQGSSSSNAKVGSSRSTWLQGDLGRKT